MHRRVIVNRSRWLIIALGLALGGLTGLQPHIAYAQAEEKPVDPAYAQAVKEGNAAFKGGRYDEAVRLFREAFAIEARGNLLYNIAISYEKGGDLVQALTFYEQFVAAVPGSPIRAKVQRHIASLKAKVADKYIEVNVVSTPPGAVVFINAKSEGALGQTPLNFNLLPGSYTLIAELEGHEQVKRPLELSEGAPQTIELRMVNSSQVGEVKLRIPERGAVVKVDGRMVGTSPLQKPLRLGQGPHNIEVMKPGIAPWQKNVNVFAGKTEQITVNFGDAPTLEVYEEETGGGGGDKLWPYVTMGVGGALLLGGTLTGLSANSLHGQLSDKRDAGEPIADSDIDRGNSLVSTTNILLITGSLALIGGGVWWYLSGDDEVDPEGDIQTGFLALPDGSAVFQLQGTF